MHGGYLPVVSNAAPGAEYTDLGRAATATLCAMTAARRQRSDRRDRRANTAVDWSKADAA